MTPPQLTYLNRIEAAQSTNVVLRQDFSLGFSDEVGGFFWNNSQVGVLRPPIGFGFGAHVYYMDLRTRTYMFSVGSISNGNLGTGDYYLAHNDEPVRELGRYSDLEMDRWRLYGSPFYGAEASNTNIAGGSSEYRYLNPILGRYANLHYVPFPPTPVQWEVEVDTNGHVIATGLLPDDTSFNLYSGVQNDELANLLEVDLFNQTVIPIMLR